MCDLNRGGFARGKWKGKAGMFIESPLDKLTSPPSLEALLSDSTLFKEIPMEDLDDGAFSSLGELFGKET